MKNTETFFKPKETFRLTMEILVILFVLVCGFVVSFSFLLQENNLYFNGYLIAFVFLAWRMTHAIKKIKNPTIQLQLTDTGVFIFSINKTIKWEEIISFKIEVFKKIIIDLSKEKENEETTTDVILNLKTNENTNDIKISIFDLDTDCKDLIKKIDQAKKNPEIENLGIENIEDVSFLENYFLKFYFPIFIKIAFACLWLYNMLYIVFM